MSSATSHPRRRPARTSDEFMTPSLIDSFQTMSIRKGDTYHPNNNTTSKSDFWDPLESRVSSPPMPVRSATSPKSLEDLLMGAGERRVAHLLNRVDKAINAKSRVALAHVLSDPDVLPSPNVQQTKTRTRHHSHSSDSGIGSSVADSTESAADKLSTRSGEYNRPAPPHSYANRMQPVARSEPSPAVDQSFYSISAADEERGLSKYAADQIHRYIIRPILREDSLAEFHDLIQSVPSRIGNKEIKNLRDLEKTLIFLAPEYSFSPSKYLHFCERTIRVLHTTVTTLHESDQRAPADRPYTQGYFFDLVEQIRRYATILAATREKEAKGEKLDKMDYTPDEKVSIHGGVSHNGKPAELVRHTADGKAISIATGQPISEEELASASSMKRHVDVDDEDDDDVLRSMARRKKNAKPEIHTCELCNKEFKRPCDLTKHVKTHERPWKCPREDCKYHAHGWPTEKERDRHVNDKHSNTPSLYHCLFKPCPYTSKRESNCKQHMEKAHGWNYIRSKSNGKGHASNVTRLHQGSVPPSPSSSMMTPLTPLAPSPSLHTGSESSRSGSMAPPPAVGPSTFGSHVFQQPSPDFADHFNMNFDFNDMSSFAPTSAFPITPAMSEERRASGTLSSHSGFQFDGSSFDDASPHDLTFNDFNWGGLSYQQFTPNSATGPSSSGATHTSPGAELDQTFTSPHFYDAMNLDEGYVDEYATSGPSADFTLFGAAASATVSGAEMFPSLAEGSWGNLGGNMGGNFGTHFDMSNAASLPTGNSTLDELFPELKNH